MASGANAEDAGEALQALVHTAESREACDAALLDVADLGAGGDDDLAGPAHRPRSYRYRVRAVADEMDVDAGPLEHVLLFLDAGGARRLAALLRRGIAEGDHGR